MLTVETSVTLEGAEEPTEGSVSYDAGNDLTEMVDKFGEKLVFDLACDSISRKLKSVVRRELKAGAEPSALADRIAGWRPDATHTVNRVVNEDTLVADFATMDKEAQLEAIEKLKEKYGV